MTSSASIAPVAPGFEGRWVVVSGASSGIGRAIAVELVAQGARAVLVGRDEGRLHETAQACGPSDRTATCALDLSDLAGIAARVKELSRSLGRFYGLCHAAGAVQTLPLSALKPERVRALLDLNFGAGLELARAVSERSVMAEDGGSLLWISSVAAHVGAPGQIAYGASKGAVGAAVRAMAVELAPRRVRVNALSPGMVETHMNQATGLSTQQLDGVAARHPLGIGQPHDVARAAAFLLHPANRWITGTDLVVDGGYSAQ